MEVVPWRLALVVVMLTLGTGVGGAVLADGRLLRGARGRAGHLGHLSVTTSPERGIVGTPGTLEDAIRAYERGDALRRHCAAKLAEAEAKVSRIVEAGGTATGTEPLDADT